MIDGSAHVCTRFLLFGMVASIGFLYVRLVALAACIPLLDFAACVSSEGTNKREMAETPATTARSLPLPSTRPIDDDPNPTTLLFFLVATDSRRYQTPRI